MGTPEFAVPILDELTHPAGASVHEVVAVYTRADKPAGRGKQLNESPVKIFAREKNLTIEQPRTLRDAAVLARLREYQPEVILVAAYGLILPQAVIDIPPRGCINVHASLLPRWRGASPITAAILAGDTETGVTLMQMDVGLDTGPMIAWERVAIESDDTTDSLTLKLAQVGAEILIRTLPAWLSGALTPTPQNEAEATLTRLVKKEDGQIDWTKPAIEIARAVRAYNPWPSAYTFLHPFPIHGGGEGAGGALLKIWRAELSAEVSDAPPGTVIALDGEIGVSTNAGVLILQEVQLAGKRAMSIDEFVRGQRGFVGARLGN